MVLTRYVLHGTNGTKEGHIAFEFEGVTSGVGHKSKGDGAHQSKVIPVLPTSVTLDLEQTARMARLGLAARLP